MAYKDTILNNFSAMEEIASLQKESLQLFEKQGIPTTKHEEWKFTNLSKIFSKDFSSSSEKQLATDENLDKMDVIKVVLQNGKFDSRRSESIDYNGLEICDLSQKLKDSSFAKEKFNSTFNSDSDAMVHLTTGLLSGGVYIKVKKSKSVEKPILIQQLFDANDINTASYSRFFVEVEENAEATIILSNKSNGTLSSFSNLVGEVFVQKNARFKFNILQNDHSEASQINNINIMQKKESVVDVTTITIDGELVRNNLNLILDDERIESNFSSLYLIKGKTHVDNHTVADHKYPNCVSNELYKGIIDERARGVFNGKIFVRQDAQKTEAYQSNNNILLSDDAIINTKPQLEIWADDVKCSHGCTVGQLDKEALFYLKTRGVGEQKAKALLLESFAMEVVEKISFEPFKDYVSKLISERLGNEVC